MALFGGILNTALGALAPKKPTGIGAAIGQQISNVGSALRLPEMHISEAFSGYNQPAQTHASTGGQVLGAADAKPIPTGIATSYNTGGGGGGYAPSSGGQAAAPSGGGGGGNPGISADNNYLQQLRDAFSGVKQGYEDQINSYDSDYNNEKGANDARLAAAADAKNTQDQADEKTYGTNLKQLLQADQDLRARRQGTYSALGTLDSSAFQQDTLKGDQQLLNNQQELVSARDHNKHDRESAYNQFVSDSNSKLAAYANEISRAKAGLRQAIASTDMNQANSIQQYISGLQQQAQQEAQQQQAIKMNLAQLAAQGVDVVGNLNKINMNQFSNVFGGNLQNQLAAGQARYTVPTNNATGQGFINKATGKPYSPEELRALGLA